MTRQELLKYLEGEFKAINRLLSEMEAVLSRRAKLRELPRANSSRTEDVN